MCGVVDRVNKLICVRALHRRYSAEVGDVVVGRVSEVCCCLVARQILLDNYTIGGVYLSSDIPRIVLFSDKW